jgi:hypothetical protein
MTSKIQSKAPVDSETKTTTETDKDTSVAEKADKPKFDKEELLRIFDEMIFSGEYIEDVLIKKKLKLKFRTRSAKDTMEISKDIDSKSFTLINTLSEYRAVQNLAYSLVSYSGNDLSQMPVEERVKYVTGLPGIIVGTLSDALAKFDQKIAAAFDEGQENF